MDVDIKLPYVQWVKAKGHKYPYYRRNGVSQRIEGETTLEFLDSYQRIHASFENSTAPKGIAPGTVEDVAQQYLASPEYDQLADKTKGDYRYYVDLIRATLGDFPVSSIKRSHIKAL